MTFPKWTDSAYHTKLQTQALFCIICRPCPFRKRHSITSTRLCPLRDPRATSCIGSRVYHHALLVGYIPALINAITFFDSSDSARKPVVKKQKLIYRDIRVRGTSPVSMTMTGLVDLSLHYQCCQSNKGLYTLSPVLN